MDIAADDYIGDYIGDVYTLKKTLQLLEKQEITTTYLFEYKADEFYIAGDTRRNLMRYMNHAPMKHGANVYATKDKKKKKVYFNALRDIKKGEELLYDYGYDPATL